MTGHSGWDDLLLEDTRLLIEQEHLDPLSRLMMGLTTRSCYKHWKKTYQQNYIDGIGDQPEEVDPAVRSQRLMRQYLVLHGVPELAKKWEYKYTFDFDDAHLAAKSGNLEILVWLLKPQGYVKQSFLTVELGLSALDGGHIPVVQWLLDNHCPLPKYGILCAIKTGHVHLVHWLHEVRHFDFPGREYYQGLIHPNSSLSAAIRSGNLDLLEWIFNKQGKPGLPPSLILEALFYGHLKIAQWLFDQKCPWSKTVLITVCEERATKLLEKIHGDLTPLFQWAWDHGPCELHPLCFNATLMCNDKPAVLWLLQHNCPINWNHVRWDSEHTAISSWALEQKKRLGLPG